MCFNIISDCAPRAACCKETGPEWLFRGTEFTQEILAEDITRPLHEPSPICKRGREFPNKLALAKLKPGESIKWTNDDGIMLVRWRDRRDVYMIVMLVKWRDRCDVYMIATNDEGLDVVRQVRRNNMPCDTPTPCCVRKYNSLMSGVDRMDQLPSYYSVGRADRRWWKYNSLMGGVDRMDQLRSYYSVGRADRRWWKYNSLMHGVDRMDQLRSYYSVGRADRRWWKYNSLMGGVIQLSDGWCRQDGPASVLLQCGPC